MSVCDITVSDPVTGKNSPNNWKTSNHFVAGSRRLTNWWSFSLTVHIQINFSASISQSSQQHPQKQQNRISSVIEKCRAEEQRNICLTVSDVCMYSTCCVKCPESFLWEFVPEVFWLTDCWGNIWLKSWMTNLQTVEDDSVSEVSVWVQDDINKGWTAPSRFHF